MAGMKVSRLNDFKLYVIYFRRMTQQRYVIRIMEVMRRLPSSKMGSMRNVIALLDFRP